MHLFKRNSILLWCAIAFSFSYCSLKKKNTCNIISLTHYNTKEKAALMQRKSDLSVPYAEGQMEVARLKNSLEVLQQKIEFIKKSTQANDHPLVDLIGEEAILKQQLQEREAFVKKIKLELMQIMNQL